MRPLYKPGTGPLRKPSEAGVAKGLRMPWWGTCGGTEASLQGVANVAGLRSHRARSQSARTRVCARSSLHGFSTISTTFCSRWTHPPKAQIAPVVQLRSRRMNDIWPTYINLPTQTDPYAITSTGKTKTCTQFNSCASFWRAVLPRLSWCHDSLPEPSALCHTYAADDTAVVWKFRRFLPVLYTLRSLA